MISAALRGVTFNVELVRDLLLRPAIAEPSSEKEILWGKRRE